jgi:hypothetical protein
MGLNSFITVLLACLGFTFAAAQQVPTPQEYYQFVNSKMQNIQSQQWDYYRAAVHANDKKAAKSRSRLIKEINATMREVYKFGPTRYAALQKVLILYLTDLRSYHVEDYDLAMDYDIPHYVDSRSIVGYVENAINADTILLENKESLHAAMNQFKIDQDLKEVPFYKNELQEKLNIVQIIYTQSHAIYAVFNFIRADQVKFIETIKRKDINAAMQLLDALNSDTTATKTSLLTDMIDVNELRFRQDLTSGLLLFKNLATNIAPVALATEMQKADELAVNGSDTTDLIKLKKNNEKVKEPMSAGLRDYYLKITEQARRINESQLQYLLRTIPKK